MNTPARAPVRRSIRLKEWRPSQDALLQPTPAYLAATDGSLTDAACRLRTDGNGFILAPETLDHFEESLVFLGDSFVESVYVPEDKRFPAATQSTLRSAGLGVHCLNGGYSGATTLHLLLALLAKVGRSPRTSVCLVVPSNDALALAKKGGYWCRDDARYSPIVPIPESAKAGNQPFDVADLTSVLNLFVDTCRRLRLGLILATFPHRTASFESDPWLQRRFATAANYARLHSVRARVNDAVRAVARRLALPLLDFDAQLSTRTTLFYDDLHLNVSGSERAAELVADAWLKHRAAPSPVQVAP